MVIGGLAVRGGQRGLYDRFRGRLVWPIRDLSGDVVGFGARKLRDDERLGGPGVDVHNRTSRQCRQNPALARFPVRGRGDEARAHGDALGAQREGGRHATPVDDAAGRHDRHVDLLPHRLQQEAELFMNESDKSAKEQKMRIAEILTFLTRFCSVITQKPQMVENLKTS